MLSRAHKCVSLVSMIMYGIIPIYHRPYYIIAFISQHTISWRNMIHYTARPYSIV